MKIKNEYVKICVGNKKYNFNNLILDTYLRAMVYAQEDFNNEYWQSPFLAKCFIKYNTRLYFDETSVLFTDDFNEEIPMISNYMNTSYGKNEIEYVYKSNSDNSGKKITAIGFFDENGDTCYACLDLYDYSLTIKSAENISIVRKDVISTEASFIPSSSKVKYPIHLSPYMVEWYEKNPKTTQEYPYFSGYASAHLESVGLSTNKTTMKKEIILDSENTYFSGEEIIFRNIFNSDNLLDILEPGLKYPSSNLFPTDTENYFTYILLKYKLYYNIYSYPGSENYQHVDTGEWYMLSIPIKETGEFDYAIKYERSDNNGI